MENNIKFIVGEDELFYLLNGKVIGVTIQFKSTEHFITKEGFYLKVENCNSFKEYFLNREKYLELRNKENEVEEIINYHFDNIDKMLLYSFDKKNYNLEEHLGFEIKQYKDFLNHNHNTLADNEYSYSGNWVEEHIEQKEKEWINNNQHYFREQGKVDVIINKIKICKYQYLFSKESINN